jgi:hypothetical protein
MSRSDLVMAGGGEEETFHPAGDTED